MRVNDGGPAFPTVKLETPGEAQVGQFFTTGDKPGMSLRDWFAGQALAGFCVLGPGMTIKADKAAADSYAAADAMLAARVPRPEPSIEPLVGGSVSVELDQPSQTPKE